MYKSFYKSQDSFVGDQNSLVESKVDSFGIVWLIIVVEKKTNDGRRLIQICCFTAGICYIEETVDESEACVERPGISEQFDASSRLGHHAKNCES